MTTWGNIDIYFLTKMAVPKSAKAVSLSCFSLRSESLVWEKAERVPGLTRDLEKTN